MNMYSDASTGAHTVADQLNWSLLVSYVPAEAFSSQAVSQVA